jgi:signal transduction histidine kinase
MRTRSIRARLTIVYAVVLLTACAVLLVLNYTLLYGSLFRDVSSPIERPSSTSTALVSRGQERVIDKKAVLEAQRRQLDQLRSQTLVRTAETSVLTLAVIAIVGLGVSWWVAGRATRPLRRLTAATRRISQDRLHERVALDGPENELKELADTFDDMIARLEAAFRSQRRFVADAAHELRTPLAIARTSVEVQLGRVGATTRQWEGTAGTVLEATRRAETLLAGLLALARSDSGVLDIAEYDLAVSASRAVSEVDEEAEQLGLTLRTDLRPAPLLGDAVLLDRLAANIVINAVRHNRCSGWLEVSTATLDGHAVLTARNSGALIDDQQLADAFEPFHRLPQNGRESRSGSGLGLAIVRSIVEAHQGDVRAEAIPGGGLSVIVSLPAAHAERRHPSA